MKRKALPALSGYALCIAFFLPSFFSSLHAQCPCPTNNELACATQYLNSLGILDNPNTNTVDPIIREDLAKVAFIAVYGNDTEPVAADSFPTPFADLQGNWIEYYKYAKAMSYLEYGDGIPPFDRAFFNFRPGGSIQRRDVAKVICESFDLVINPNEIHDFGDVDPGDPQFEYINTLLDYELIMPNPNFYPEANATRGEVFLMLYRLLCNNSDYNGVSPTDDDFFTPGNYHPFNLNNRPSLSDANFDAYSKVSFNISGRNMPLVFAHNYNSHLTELPDELFPVCPIGRGWSHSYNAYITMIPGYVAGSNTMNDQYVVFWPGGSMYVFELDGNTVVAKTRGVYDDITYNASLDQFVITKKNQMVYTFEKVTGEEGAPFMLKKIADRNNNTVSLSYQNNPIQLAQVTGTAGRKLTFSYHSNGMLASVTDPISRVVTFDYDPATFDLLTYTDAESLSTTYLYATDPGEEHLLTNITLPNGNTIDNEYENRKLRSTQTNMSTTGQQIMTEISDWDYNGSVLGGTNSTVLVTDGSNPPRAHDYVFNGQGQITSLLTPTNEIDQVVYGDPTNPTLPTVVTVDGVTTTYEYFPFNGNVKKISQPENVVHEFTYTNLNDIQTYKNPRGFTTTFGYDGPGNLKSIQTPIGTTTIDYNNYGQPTKVTNPENISVTFGYNAFGNQNMVTAPDGIISGATYDGASRLKESTNPNGQTTIYEYDARDFVVQTTDAMNYVTQFRYDDNGNLFEIENALNEITTLNYDDNDFLRSESFGGFTKEYDYDDEGKLIKLTKPDGTELDYTYHATTGNLIDDDYATYTYDNRNRLKKVTKDNKEITYEYDQLNRIISVEYDNEEVKYEYDENSNVTKLTYPDNKEVIYTYDAKDRMETVTDWNGNTTTYEYYDDDRLKICYLPNGTSYDYEYDDAGRVEKLIHYRNNGTPWIRYTYDLDKVGNHLSEEKIDEPFGYPAAPTESFTYSYNNINRIETATGDMGTNISWSFDDNGNTISKTGTTYNWDDHDMLTNYNDGTDNLIFLYDGLGNRREAVRNLITFKYTLDILGMSRVLRTTDAGGNVQDYYVYGLDLISNVKPNGDTYYYHHDFRGSIVAMTDQSQTVTHSYNYDEYGKVTDVVEAHYNPFRFVGKFGVMYETDELTFMRARYYDPSIGRFLSEDPIWSTNLYAYAGGNPVRIIDPSGEIGIAGAAIGFFAGGVAQIAADLIIEGRVDDWQGVFRSAAVGAVAGATGGLSLTANVGIVAGASLLSTAVYNEVSGSDHTALGYVGNFVGDVIPAGVSNVARTTTAGIKKTVVSSLSKGSPEKAIGYVTEATIEFGYSIIPAIEGKAISEIPNMFSHSIPSPSNTVMQCGPQTNYFAFPATSRRNIIGNNIAVYNYLKATQ